MKILLLSDANSVHTIRWVESLKKNNLDLLLFSLFKPTTNNKKKYNELGVCVISPDLRNKIKKIREPNFSKIKYFSSIFLLNKTIKDFKPNIIHAHYASSYGVLAFFARFKPFILSVWGSDVYDFPTKNLFNKFLINKIIKKADIVCSTSNEMKKLVEKEFQRYDVKIVPFGIDSNLFIPKHDSKMKFTAGTIKSIEKHNGISCLLDAAKIIIHDHKKNINFLIVGEGSLKNKMKKKALTLGISDNVCFTGFVQHKKILKYYQRLSVFVALSERESFGVSVLEAASCEIPSITSNIGGLIEVNSHNESGFVVNVNDSKGLAHYILKLFENENLRKKLGVNARKRVKKQFDWNDNIHQMIKIYNDLCILPKKLKN